MPAVARRSVPHAAEHAAGECSRGTHWRSASSTVSGGAGANRPAIGGPAVADDDRFGVKRDGGADVPRHAVDRRAPEPRRFESRRRSRARRRRALADGPRLASPRRRRGSTSTTRGCGFSEATALCPRSQADALAPGPLTTRVSSIAEGGTRRSGRLGPVAGVPQHGGPRAQLHAAPARVDRKVGDPPATPRHRQPVASKSRFSDSTAANPTSDLAVRAATSRSRTWPSYA